MWIRFLAKKAPCAAELDRLLTDDAVAGHEVVVDHVLPDVRIRPWGLTLPFRLRYRLA